MDDSVALNESRTKQMVSFKNVEQSIADDDDDDDDDDALLTQALELQESKAEYKSNTPPAKKVGIIKFDLILWKKKPKFFRPTGKISRSNFVRR